MVVSFLIIPIAYFFLVEVRATLRFSRVASCSATASSSGVDLDQSEASVMASWPIRGQYCGQLTNHSSPGEGHGQDGGLGLLQRRGEQLGLTLGRGESTL